MKLKDIMTEKVETVDTGDSLRRAADIMRKKDIGILPVFSKRALVGVVTDRDIVIRGVSRGLDPETARVDEVMTARVESGTEEMDVNDAAKIMEDKQIRRLLVLDTERHLLGIVTLGDIATRTHDADIVEGISLAVSHP
jgi:CBS domain-containing protein